MKYKINTLLIHNGFDVNEKDILEATKETNLSLTRLPSSLYTTIDYKTTNTIIGRLFCDTLARQIKGAIVNPIEKGHPDIIPINGKNATEAQLRNYPEGLEIKCTVGNIKQGSNLRAGTTRLDQLTGLTWQAHHQEVKELLGLVWDFANKTDDNSYNYPAITGAFFNSSLNVEDWGVISGTTGRNTKVCGMKASGRIKMSKGWILIDEHYFDRYMKLLGSGIKDS